MSDLRSRALACLRDGRVHILYARTPADGRWPVEVVAVIEGHTGIHRVNLRDGAWTCDCKAVFDDGQECAHLAAVQLVTSHSSAAAKPQKASAAA